MSADGGVDARDRETPYWRREARQSAESFREGIDLLGGTLEFAVDRLEAIYGEGRAGGGGRSFLPVFAARAISTVDAIHALLTVGRVEQADMLVRTLVDLQADAHILVGTEDAVSYYVDWAQVEQARAALQMRPEESLRPLTDLAARREELANELLSRLGDHEPETASRLKGRPLDEVLESFCKIRYRSRSPISWKQGYMRGVGLTAEAVRERIVVTAAEAAQLEGLPNHIREFFQQTFARELELLFGYLSAEIHNSPLAINRLIDPSTKAIRIYGDTAGLPRPLMGAFQHLLRIMLLLETEWTDHPANAEWSSRALAMSESVGGLP